MKVFYAHFIINLINDKKISFRTFFHLYFHIRTTVMLCKLFLHYAQMSASRTCPYRYIILHKWERKEQKFSIFRKIFVLVFLVLFCFIKFYRDLHRIHFVFHKFLSVIHRLFHKQWITADFFVISREILC